MSSIVFKVTSEARKKINTAAVKKEVAAEVAKALKNRDVSDLPQTVTILQWNGIGRVISMEWDKGLKYRMESKRCDLIADIDGVVYAIDHGLAKYAPKVVAMDQAEDDCFVVTNVSDGVPLNTLWKDSSDEFKKTFTASLAEMLESFSALTYDNVAMTSIHARMLNDNVDVYAMNEEDGAFMDRELFSEELIASFPKGVDEADVAKLKSYIMTSPRLVFCHGYLMDSNIYVNKRGEIVYVTSWESCGYFPEGWEHVMIEINNRYDSCLRDVMKEISQASLDFASVGGRLMRTIYRY